VSAHSPQPEMPVRASQILRVRKIWLLPAVIAAVFVTLLAFVYLGAVVNPTGHLHGLPVMVVNEDQGASVHGQDVRIGASVVKGLEQSHGVASRLDLRNATLSHAKATMDRGGAYATVVIPATLSESVLAATGADGASAGVPAKASIELLENSRLGSLGVNLAAGVLTPAIEKISRRIGSNVSSLATPAAVSNPLVVADLADPVALTTSSYRPLPDHSALGLSAFYIALLSIMVGFISSTLINSSIDSALGYGATELGPHWRHRRPVAINRRQTLLVKWGAALLVTPVVTVILLLVAVGALHMYAPHLVLLWLLAALAALMIATGTLSLLSIFGSIGQLLAMILLVYLSLASSGGTVPIQALPGFFNVVGHVEPLRQVLDGTRAIMYFGARGDAGLTHSVVVLACELAFWMIVGLAVTSWYDHKKLYRLAPDVFASVERAIDQRLRERAAGIAAATPTDQMAEKASPSEGGPGP